MIFLWFAYRPLLRLGNLALVRAKTFSRGQTLKRMRFVRKKGGIYGQSSAWRLSIIQAECPERNGVAECEFDVILHNIGIRNILYLLSPLVSTADLEGIFSNDKV